MMEPYTSKSSLGYNNTIYQQTLIKIKPGK